MEMSVIQSKAFYPRSDRPSSILGAGILFHLFNLYGYVRVPVRVPVRAIVPFVCVRLFMCHARWRRFHIFNILFSNIIFLCEYVLCVRFLTERKSTDERVFFSVKNS
jgi:hypothetical protein